MTASIEVCSPLSGLYVFNSDSHEAPDVEELISESSNLVPGLVSGYDLLGSNFTKTRGPTNPRPYWSADHHWHYDLMQEGLNIGKLITVLSCTEAETGAPGIEFVDTVQLHALLLEQRFYAKLRYGITDLMGLYGQYSRAYFWNNLLPGEIAEIEDEQTQTETASATKSYNLEAGFDEDGEYPVDSVLPVITTTEEGDAITFDQERCFDFKDQEGKSHTELLTKLREHLTRMYSEYVELGIIHIQPLSAGTTLLFRREGLLHRSMPGNGFNRSITLSWLASNAPDVEQSTSTV
jgi:hypothetical protein